MFCNKQTDTPVPKLRYFKSIETHGFSILRIKNVINRAQERPTLIPHNFHIAPVYSLRKLGAKKMSHSTNIFEINSYLEFL